MCGRYTLSTPADLVADHFGLGETPEIAPRYNIAPSQETLIVAARDRDTRVSGPGRWGLVPPWRATKSQVSAFINARIETAAEKPAFRSSLTRRRCLVPADGFYEWSRRAGRKQPYYFRLGSGRPMAFAGLWTRWRKEDGEQIVTFAILTTEANAQVRPIHPRMPVILRPDDYSAWLRRQELEPLVLDRLRTPYPAQAMESWPVSTFVNDPGNDSPLCIRWQPDS
jgi:putative SOS response-associated peptidase YedK